MNKSMKIRESIDNISGVTTFAITGDLDFNELITFIITFYEESELNKSYLWNFRNIKGGDQISIPQMGQLFKLCRKYFYRYPSQKISVLDAEHLGFGFTQVMSKFEELCEVYLNVKVFQDYERAMEWILSTPE
jgi:hypothetical protein